MKQLRPPSGGTGPALGLSAPLIPRRRLLKLDVVARNRLLFDACEVPGKAPLQLGSCLTLAVGDARAVHVRDILRLEAGETVRVGVVGGCRADAQVQFGSPSGELQLTVTRVDPALPAPRVDLLLALPRPKALRRLWPVLGELGVGCVMLTGAQRVEKTFFAAGAALDPDQVRSGLVKGLEQSGDTTLPHVALSRTLKGALRHMDQRYHMDQLAHMDQRYHVAAGGAGGTTNGEVAGAGSGARVLQEPDLDMGPGGAMPGGCVEAPGGRGPGVELLPVAVGPGGRRGKGQGQVPDKSPGALPWGVSYLVGSWPESDLGAVPGDDGSGREHTGNTRGAGGSGGGAGQAGAGVLRVVGHPHADAPLLRVLQEHLGGTRLLGGVPDRPGHTSDGVCQGSQQTPHGADRDATLGLGRVLIAVGPEGGWLPDELDLLMAHGFVPVGLGPRVLTTTTALISMVGCVQQALLLAVQTED